MKPWTARKAGIACTLALCGSVPARAQTLPSEPIAFADGRVTFGGDVSASIAPDDTGFFNYTDYQHSALRLLRIDFTGSVKAGDHLAVLGEVRSENVESPRPYALFLRIRPWTARQFDIQVGRVPPTFGAFARRTYAADNPLIGYPLAYQYLTSLRPDALPANANELLAMRGRGWLSNYSIGNPTPHSGLAIASAFRWDTGVQMHVASGAMPCRRLDVRENVKFFGGQVPRWVHENFPHTVCALAIEVKKFFMNEWTGELDSKQHQAIGSALAAAATAVREELEKLQA